MVWKNRPAIASRVIRAPPTCAIGTMTVRNTPSRLTRTHLIESNSSLERPDKLSKQKSRRCAAKRASYCRMQGVIFSHVIPIATKIYILQKNNTQWNALDPRMSCTARSLAALLTIEKRDNPSAPLVFKSGISVTFAPCVEPIKTCRSDPRLYNRPPAPAWCNETYTCSGVPAFTAE